MGNVVKPSKNMSDEIFFKHMNARHTPIAGLSKLHDHVSPGVTKAMREYHKRVHRTNSEGEPGTKREPNHTHGIKKESK